MTNSEDTDEILQNVAFHQDLHCFAKIKPILGTAIHLNPYKSSVLLRDIANSANPDQTHHAVSDQDLHCLFTEFSIKIGIKMKNTTQ